MLTGLDFSPISRSRSGGLAGPRPLVTWPVRRRRLESSIFRSRREADHLGGGLGLGLGLGEGEGQGGGTLEADRTAVRPIAFM